MDDHIALKKHIISVQNEILAGLKARNYDELEKQILKRYELILALSHCPVPIDELLTYINEIKSFDAIFSSQANDERTQIQKLMNGINKVKHYLNV